MLYREVNEEEMNEIIECRKPLGLFWRKYEKTGLYIAVDNTTGDAWTEEFETELEARRWLKIDIIEDFMKKYGREY